jgi:hypothetical protein
MDVVAARDYRPGLLDGLWVKTTGRSWWSAQYTDGRVVHEWQTLASLDPSSSRWEETKREGLRVLILVTPDRKAYRLTSAEDHKLFQLKLGVFTVGLGTTTDAHLIGVVVNTFGDCVCFAWEPQEKRTVKVEDNVLNMQYRKIGPLGLENLRLKF